MFVRSHIFIVNSFKRSPFRKGYEVHVFSSCGHFQQLHVTKYTEDNASWPVGGHLAGQVFSFCLTRTLCALIQNIHLQYLILSQLNPINDLSSYLIKTNFCIFLENSLTMFIFNTYSGIYLAMF
jgi:hypothetical protein